MHFRGVCTASSRLSRDRRTRYFAGIAAAPDAVLYGTAATPDVVAGPVAGAASAPPGICVAAVAALAPEAGVEMAGRSRTLPVGAARVRSLARNASSSVHAKKIAAHTAVDRDRKLALPVAPKRLPEAPLPKDAPMSAPLPCCTSTRPIITSAARIWTITTKFNIRFMFSTFQETHARQRKPRDIWQKTRSP